MIRWRFSTEKFERMIRAGILTADDRVELIEGEIIEMSPIGERHAACVNRLNRMLTLKLGARALVSVQNPIRLGSRSRPQPDVAVLKPRDDFYASALPAVAYVLLIVEVADTSQDADRNAKLPPYARAGIQEAWLVDLEERAVEIGRTPGPEGYADRRSARAGEAICPAAFDDVEVGVDDILP